MKPNLWQKMFTPDSDPRSIPSLGKKIHRYASAIDYHLSNLKYVLQDLEEIKQVIYDLENAEIASQFYESENTPYNTEYQNLKSLFPRWPLAVCKKNICKSEPDWIERAASISDLYLGKHFLEGLKFLDFGCGEGYVNKAVLREQPAISVGYDPTTENFTKENLVFTNDIKEVEKYQPYDVILAFDVLDHLENEDPEKVVKKLTSMLTPSGTIYVRCHPWTSRHATHLYEKGLNLAYAHLVYDDIELTRLGGFQNITSYKTINPLKTYKKWFTEAGLLIKEENPIYSEIESFFYRPELVKRIRRHWPTRDFLVIPDELLNIEFIDYELIKFKEIL